jgi:signal transduction histidine kinase
VTQPEAPASAAGASAPAPARPVHRLTLRAKGALALVAVVVYVVGVGLLLADSRHKQLLMVEDLERTHRVEELLVQVNMAVARAILTVNDHYSMPDPSDAVQPVGIEIEAVQASLAGLRASFPMLERNIASLEYDLDHLRATPGRGDIAALRSTLHELVVQLDNITAGVRDKKEKLLSGYRAAQERVTMEILVFSLLGISMLGIVTALFFTQLAWDIRHVAVRAVAVVKGYRGEPLPVTRGDEVGELMEALNHVQQELRSHELQLELSRQQTFHKEKMAAVGSLAAQLAHEINNPIAAISGVAQSISDVRSTHHCPNHGIVCQPELILEQAKRVALITRQIAEFTAPQSPEAQLLDLNGLVRSTCSFISYDRRFKNIQLDTDLDPQLPALHGIGDHLTQVLMNLLINAADAMEGVVGRRPAITVSTRREGERVLLAVADNGHGMSAEVRSRAFDEFFTTKAAGKGSGLGLALCRNLIESRGGSIAIDSAKGEGTRIRISLPLADEYAVAA